MILKVKRTSMSFKSWFGILEDAGGPWLEFGILILIRILSLVFGTPMFQILALYLDFEGAKNIYVLQVWICGFGGCWRFLTGVWHHDLDLDMATGLWYSHDLNFWSLSWFWRCKEHPCPLSPDFGLWRTLEVPDLGLSSWSWFGYVLNFGSLSWYWRWKEHLWPFSVNLGFRGCWRFLTGVRHLDFDLDMVTGFLYTNDQNFGSNLNFAGAKNIHVL